MFLTATLTPNGVFEHYNKLICHKFVFAVSFTINHKTNPQNTKFLYRDLKIC